jgi:hypothetical protein
MRPTEDLPRLYDFGRVGWIRTPNEIEESKGVAATEQGQNDAVALGRRADECGRTINEHVDAGRCCSLTEQDIASCYPLNAPRLEKPGQLRRADVVEKLTFRQKGNQILTLSFLSLRHVPTTPFRVLDPAAHHHRRRRHAVYVGPWTSIDE